MDMGTALGCVALGRDLPGYAVLAFLLVRKPLFPCNFRAALGNDPNEMENVSWPGSCSSCSSSGPNLATDMSIDHDPERWVPRCTCHGRQGGDPRRDDGFRDFGIRGNPDRSLRHAANDGAALRLGGHCGRG